MRHPGRRPALPQTGGSWLRAFAAAALLVLCGLGIAEAREVTIRGIAGKDFGRIELTFDQTTKVSLRNNGTILVIGFAEPVRVRAERLPDELSSYVSISRRDPDGSGLRLALTRAFRVNQLEAGERVYVDLLPERWTGLPPGLPPEVVAELAERARRAEEKLKAEATRRIGPPRPVLLRIAQDDQQTRLVFEPPAGTAMRFEDRPGATTLRLDGNLAFDLAGSRPKAAEGVEDFSASRDETGVTIRVTAKPDRTLRAFLDEGTAVVDLLAPAPPPALPVAAAAPPQPPAPPAVPPPARETARTPEAPAPAERAAAPAPDPLVPVPTETAVPAAASVIRPRLEPGPDEPAFVIPFGRPTPAAAFERGGRVTIVFRTSDRIDLTSLAAASRESLGLRALREQGTFSVLTFDARPDRPLRLVPEGSGWRLVFGGTAPPPDDVLVTRTGGPDGRGEVAVALAGASVHWLLDPDDAPLAVVTTSARQGLATARRFVEFQLPQTLLGAVVQPSADGVQVALGRGGVVVTRDRGLSLSTVGQPGIAADRHPFVIRGDEWESDTSGDFMSRYRTFVATAAEASRADKAGVRFELARLLIANGLAHEAASLLAAATTDDPLFARRRETLLLAGIAAVRARHPKQARAFLSDEVLGNDPEAALWRAALDAEGRDWAKALPGLRRAEPVLTRYPDALVGGFRLMTVRAAVATGDVKTAEDTFAAIERLPLGSVPRDEVELARATIDDAAGRSVPALAGYEKLVGSASRPVAAEAVLRAVRLGRRTARMPVAEAISRLETLAVSWRGDEIELGTMAELVRLYAETKRWRDMLMTARLAQLRFSAKEEARRAYDQAAAAFEKLLLGQDSEAMDAVEFLALYYDFKEFSPAGRRGDEIVRRIADRLVEIDLLDQAATLLQHQVDHRLTGIARATIATRLAALRLMSGKPALAIGVLQATRMADLSPALRRLRLIIEAQAQADLSRVDLALETVEGEEGADFARLRATIYFGAGRWREAGEAYEGLLGTRWQEEGGLSADERQDVVRAMLADILGQEWMGLDRIRSKFAAKMADSADAKLFEALLRPRAAQGPEFRDALREASRSDTLRRFLGDWSRVSDLPVEPMPPSGKAARAGIKAQPG